MSISNFQDVVVLNQSTVTAGVELAVLGTDVGSKSIVFAQDPAQQSALFLVASNPTAQITLNLPSVNRTIGLMTAFEASGATITNGALSINGVSGLSMSANFSTITMALSRLSAYSVGDYDAVLFASNVGRSTTLGGGATSSSTLSTGVCSALRLSMVAPMNVTYMDPLGQQQFNMSASATAGTWTLSAALTWFAGIYTLSGSTASVASSKSSSASSTLTGNGSASTSVSIDGRFTNITWDFSLGDYMLIFGSTVKMTLSRNTTAVTNSFGATALQTTFGATRAQVSYSVPYFADGTISTSAGSYNLTNIIQSGGTGVTTIAPRIHLLGS
jgi:hypothetical protein